MLDKQTFFETIRPSSLFHNSLSQQQVNGIDAILSCWNGGPEGLFKGPVYDAHLSYMLATVYHETARTMSAVREGLNASDAWRKAHLRYYPWYGRGLVQLTWERNYQRMTTDLKPFFPNIDLIKDPDQALDPAIAVGILFYGMSRGSFTGKSLHTYIHGGVCDFVNARRIINGMDKATMIAGYANVFNQAVVKATAAYKGPSSVQTAPKANPINHSQQELTVHLSAEAIAAYHKLDSPDKVIEDALHSAAKH